jgi:hypothetical protein
MATILDMQMFVLFQHVPHTPIIMTIRVRLTRNVVYKEIISNHVTTRVKLTEMLCVHIQFMSDNEECSNVKVISLCYLHLHIFMPYHQSAEI